MLKHDLLGAHIDSIWLADTQQALFQHLMQTLSRPGRIDDVSSLLESQPAYLGVLATLLDGEVSLADVDHILEAHHWPLLQAVSKTAELANFVLCDASKKPTFEPKVGTLESPDFATTLVLKVEKLNSNEAKELDGDMRSVTVKLTGAGVKAETLVQICGIEQAWLEQRNEWCSAFPLGVDCLLVDGTQVMGLPRTTKMQVLESH